MQRSRRLRRTGVAVAAAGIVVAGCSGPTVPLSVGLADRPVDLLLGERATAVAEAPVPPVAIPPAVLPDFELPFAPMPFDPGGFVTPTTSPFPSWGTTTTTLPAGCVATPPERTFDDAPDNIAQPPVATPRGDGGYVTRTEGEITVDDDTVAGTLLPTLTKQRIENVQVLARYPIGQTYQYQNNKPADGAPADFTYDVLVDVGKAENNTRTTYRVIPAYQKVVYQDYQTWVPTAAQGRGLPVWKSDGIVDDYFKDLNGDGDVYDAGEQYADQNGNGSTDWDPDPVTHKNDYGFPDVNQNGQIDYDPDNPIEYFWDSNGNGKIDLPDEQHVDMNGDGTIQYPDEENWSNYHYEYIYDPDGTGDSPSISKFNGGFYISSMLTGTKESNRITFTKVKDGAGALVDSPGALLAALPLVESNTINTEAYTNDGRLSIAFESTVFGRVDVDVCRTDLVAWKVALDRGFIASPQSAVDFSAEYSIATQHGGLFLQDKSTVKSIQAGSPTVKRTIESVYTYEPAAAADPNPPNVG